MTFHRFWRLSTRLVLIGLLLATEGLALANPLPAPLPIRPGREVQPPLPIIKQVGQAAAFVIRRDAAQEQSRIVIPRKFLPSGKAAPQGEDPFGKASTPDDFLAGSRERAVNAGLLLATVIAGGGLTVVFARRRKAGPAIGMLVGTLLLAAALGTALAGEPLAAPVDGGNLLDKAQISAASPQATVEIVETGDEITLILGKDAPQPATRSVETPAAPTATPTPPAPPR